MRRIGTELTAFAIGLVAVGSAVVSDDVFNDGRALLVGTALLSIAFMIGLTQMPFSREKPRWRMATTGIELLCGIAAVLFLVGVIGV